MESSVAHGRVLAKHRHRAALLAAARQMIDESGPAGFTTEDLARRAGLSRRTVFNHFAHLEDVAVACAEAELEAAMEAVERGFDADPGRTGPLDDLEAALTAPDVADVISRLGRVFAVPGREAVAERIRNQAMRRFGAQASHQLKRRYPELDALDVELLTTLVVSGAEHVATRWLDETGGELDAAGRARFGELMAALFGLVRDGSAARVSVTAPARPTKDL